MKNGLMQGKTNSLPINSDSINWFSKIQLEKMEYEEKRISFIRKDSFNKKKNG